MNREAKLLLTSDCSLCDEAFELLIDCDAMHGILLTTIDVASKDALFETFGERIPVLEYESRYLDWPFSSKQVEVFLGKPS